MFLFQREVRGDSDREQSEGWVASALCFFGDARRLVRPLPIPQPVRNLTAPLF